MVVTTRRENDADMIAVLTGDDARATVAGLGPAAGLGRRAGDPEEPLERWLPGRHLLHHQQGHDGMEDPPHVRPARAEC